MNKNDLKKAIKILQIGGLVGMPTETVYGLAADASNPVALQKIFQAKGRPADHPLIVHIGDLSQLEQWASHVSPQALQLAQAFWPGPLTLILQKKTGVSDLITGGQATVGIRIPNHPVALALLQGFGGGVAAPSANKFGRISPTTAAAVTEELGAAVDLVLEGGQCEVGVESTIVDMSGDEYRILRPGMISAAQIEAVLQQPLAELTQRVPRVSGSLESHYAPVTKTRLLSQLEIVEFVRNLSNEELPAALMIFTESIPELKLDVISRELQVKIKYIVMPKDSKLYAHHLYQTLRELDKEKFQQIIIEKLPDGSAWDAVRDRLQRAAY